MRRAANCCEEFQHAKSGSHGAGYVPWVLPPPKIDRNREDTIRQAQLNGARPAIILTSPTPAPKGPRHTTRAAAARRR